MAYYNKNYSILIFMAYYNYNLKSPSHEACTQLYIFCPLELAAVEGNCMVGSLYYDL